MVHACVILVPHVCMLSHSVISDMTLCDPWTAVHQAFLSIELSWQEYWSGLPFPPPGDLPKPGSKLLLLQILHWQVDSLPLRLSGQTSIRDQIHAPQ